MNHTTKAAFAIAFVIAAFLFLAFGGGMWTGTMTGHGSMGGYGMMGNGGMGGFSWMWLLGPLLIVLVVAFLWAALAEE